MTKSNSEWLEEILEDLGTAYHNNYPDDEAHNKAKQAILNNTRTIEQIEEALPSKLSYPLSEFGKAHVDGYNQTIDEIRTALNLGDK